ncbi:DUF6134 family protein [Mitsuaria sp. 7]|uniref:DUF6134 family protein n=1 Tax=Mitsuaria sp. 7 TaxID=1658665 RepID=UPI0007DD1560|nr:DUF6134 family protein [Mitsuaria sp. 7]ANH70292.1 hypothetical protein ABE85_05475 [Mitsuaria sp. 7]
MTAISSSRAFPKAAVVAAFVAVGALGAVGLAAPARAETWNFEVRLDGKPIGTHRFTVDGPAEARDVTSKAAFDVRLLGITVFRYRHEARERWRGDCLQEIHSRTDDDGKPVEVDRRLEPTAAGEATCLMSYAYWHPALVRQQRLLNPQTGDVDEVRIERLPDASIPVGGRDVDASRWRITSTSTATSAGKSPPARQVLTLWRDRADGRWIGLDAQVKGDRLLTYRLP